MTQGKIPFWRQQKNLNILIQLAVVLIVLAVLLFLGNNLVVSFRRLGLNFGFDFLESTASFDIANAPLDYQPTDSYLKAITVGLLNSLKIMFFGIVIATVLGVTVGIARLSDNWLVKQLATIYIELLRNTPLLLQLFFWYFAVFLKLPRIENAYVLNNLLVISNRGISVPWLLLSLETIFSCLLLLGLLVSAIFCWQKRIRELQMGASSGQSWLYIAICCLGLAGLTFIWGIDWNIPDYQGNSISGGANLTPEFATLLIGLSVYTASFIAEVVRAGIQSVSKGQWEAARALGLKPSSVMQLIIFPQALRVMIPPLTSEFLNLAKNSSLAIAVGYNDIYAIANTVSNQTGKSIEILLILIGTYLTINLLISLGMNRLNKTVQLTEK